MAGVDILRAGGNAVDAAICANAMLSLVEPMMCGPGGDLFAIVWNAKERKLIGLNASGRAPYDWSIDKALALGLKEIPVYGPLSWSVPGCVSGWAALQDRLGRFGLAKTLQAPIQYARQGFPVSPVIARMWSFNTTDDPGLSQTFLPGGKAIRFGDIFRNPGLARFFQIIARDGADAFYKGPIAERIVRFSQAKGGRLSMRDFRDHTVDWVEPVSTNYRGYDVWELPPNGKRPGDCGPSDPESAGTLRYRFDEAQLGRASAPFHRGKEAGLRGPSGILCRYGLCRCSGE
jgi:gamma-glutamyltranspeptidase/glutathione hydrolase